MSDIKGRVLEVTPRIKDETRMAYLYNFSVNSSILRRKHQSWLFDNLVMPALSHSIAGIKKTYMPTDPRGPVVLPGVHLPYKPPLAPPPPSFRIGETQVIVADGGSLTVDRLVVPDRWEIYLHGTTSRPGTSAYNNLLSQARANAVAKYIKAALGKTSVNCHIDPYWTGELFARMLGKKERREDPLDRAVLIAFRPVYPEIGIRLGPPVPVDRPLFTRACCAVKLRIEYLELIRDAWLLTDVPTAGSKASGKRTLDDSADYPGTSSVPHVSPDPTWLTNLFRSRGYSDERAEYLKHHGSYTSVPIVGQMGPVIDGRTYKNLDASNVTGVIGEELENLRKELINCTPADPLGECSNGSMFDYRKS